MAASAEGAGDPERQATGHLPAALCLASAGGFLDAFLYLNHGRVFAGAMTGNAVLCGIALLGNDHAEAVRHALPLAAFFCGVFLAEALQRQLRHHAVTVGLGCEIAGLLLASFLPRGFPDLLFVPWISLLAAYQIASFRRVDEYAYNSTFITGNLRTAIFGLYDAMMPGSRKEGWRQFRTLGLIVLVFLAGAAVGAILSPRMGNHALWVPALDLVPVLLLAVRRTATDFI